MEKILVICAHPDDEILGLGGTLALNAMEKNEISILIISDGETSRDSPGKIETRQKQSIDACKTIGVSNIEFLNYPDQKLETIPIADLSKDISEKISKIKPTIIFTHFWNDLNNDHRRVFEATIVSTRPVIQKNLKKILCFETPSSTEWFIGNDSFQPNVFVNIHKTISKKLTALEEFKNEMRPYPHPRSIVSIKNRAMYWGNISGMEFAEAFVLYREIQEI